MQVESNSGTFCVNLLSLSCMRLRIQLLASCSVSKLWYLSPLHKVMKQRSEGMMHRVTKVKKCSNDFMWNIRRKKSLAGCVFKTT